MKQIGAICSDDCAIESKFVCRICFPTMRPAERQLKIRGALSRQDFVSLEEFCTLLQASKATIRRDLIELEQKGNLRRVHGGAMGVAAKEEPLDFRRLSKDCREEKARIGRKAASLIKDGQTVIMGGGSTVAEVARSLVDRPIQVITNSIPVAQLFWDCKQTEVTLTGGNLYSRLAIQLGPICERMLSLVSADVLVMGVRGITEEGVSDSSALVVESIRAMIKSAERVIIVADHTKFGRKSMIPVAGLNEIDQVVSDRPLASDFMELLERKGISYTLA